MNAPMRFDTRDLAKFQVSLDKLGEKQMKKCVNKAAQKGSNAVGKAIRSSVPVKTGQLKRGFKKRKERSRIACKAVYDYAMDSAKNDLFQRPIKNPGSLGGSHKYWAYYPNSVEYGFLARAKGGGLIYYRYGRYFTRSEFESLDTANRIHVTRRTEHGVKAVETVAGQTSRKIPGKHAVRKAAEGAASEVGSTIKQVLFEEVDKAWKS